MVVLGESTVIWPRRLEGKEGSPLTFALRRHRPIARVSDEIVPWEGGADGGGAIIRTSTGGHALGQILHGRKRLMGVASDGGRERRRDGILPEEGRYGGHDGVMSVVRWADGRARRFEDRETMEPTRGRSFTTRTLMMDVGVE